MCRVLGFVLLVGWALVSCAPAARQVHNTPVDIVRDHYRAPRNDGRLQTGPLRRQRAIDLTDTLRILRNQPYIAPGNIPSVPITGPCVWQTAGPTNVNGRVTAIAVDESDPQRMFVATVGGVWRSRDGGKRWTRVTDQLQAGVFGAVAITSGNPDEVFIGGGDPNLYYSTLEMRAGGPGLWQSTNGGQPSGWQTLGPADLTNAVIFRIRVDPDTPHNVYVAASSGLWLGRRTTATGPFTWARLGDFDAPCSDVVVDFSPPNDLVYAACYPAPTVENGIWRYDGSAWTKISYGITASQAGFIRLAIARRNYPRPLFAMIEKASNGSLQGVYRTEVGAVPSGVTWTNVASPAMDDSYDYTAFNCLVEVDPENENIVYVGTAEHLFRSTDKGANWSTEISEGADYNFPNTRLHDDQHAMALAKATPGATQCDIVIVGNDGGLDRADLSKTTWHWENIGHGINATEYYYLATQQATGSLIAGGTQDNGSPITYGNRSWYGDPACDGSYVGVEGKNGCTFYQVCYTGSTDVRILRHVVPGFAGTNMIVSPSAPVPLCPPIATHPTENGKALAGGCPASGSPTLLSTGDGVAWTRVKDGSSTIVFPADAEITALGIGWPSSFQSYYVGFKRVSSNGTVTASTIWSTQNAGLAWQKPGSVGAGAQINAIAVDASNPLRAFAALGGADRVLMTTNGGTSWTGVAGTGAGSLPPVAATGVAIDPWDPDLIYVSTDVGVFRGKPSTMQWWPFDQGLPRGIDVNDITVNQDAGTLMIGTMGYGAFTRDIRPGVDCRIRQASIRDNVFDRGVTPSPTGLPDPEHPIEDTSRSIPSGGYFYKPDDTVLGRSYWWSSTDIRVDRPTASKVMNQVAVVDHVALEGCPVEVTVDDCPAGAIVDRNPVKGDKARVLVQVTNRGTAPIENLRVTVLWAEATTSLPLLPVNFWSTSFPASGTCSPVTSGPWLSVDSGSPCRDLAVVRPEYPEVVEFAWEVPDNAPAHSCIMALVESADDPIDPLVRTSNERRPWVLVPENRQIALRNLHVEDAPPKPLSATAAHQVAGLDSLRVWNPTSDPSPFDLEISRPSMRATGKLGLMLPQDSDSLRFQGTMSTAPALTPAQLEAVRNLGVDTTKVHWITQPEATIEGIKVAPGQSKKIAVIYDSGAGRPWGTTRFVVAARRDRVIYGGSTYLLRTPVKP